MIPTSAQEVVGVQRRGKALVVDDDPTQRLLLSIQLAKEGFEVVVAENGVEAVQRFVEEAPDIVFMDVMMPIMDGYQATREIKSLTVNRFVPVIFLSSLEEDVALVQGIACGGDDFLHKPSKPALLSAKIAAFERICALYRTASAQRDRIGSLHSELLREQELAQRIFNGVITAGRVQLPSVRMLLQPAATFSGDLLLMAYRPDGGLNVFLGDSTGHGLTAAIAAIPASEVFYAMTAKGSWGGDILEEINHKIYRLLPTGMFMAGTLVSIASPLHEGYIWNCGMPDVLVLSADAQTFCQRVASHSPPLGIVSVLPELHQITAVELHPGERIVMCSDGLLEAVSPSGEQFSQRRFERALLGSDPEQGVGGIRQLLSEFCLDRPFDDDVSLVDICCDTGITQGRQGGRGDS